MIVIWKRDRKAWSLNGIRRHKILVGGQLYSEFGKQGGGWISSMPYEKKTDLSKIMDNLRDREGTHK